MAGTAASGQGFPASPPSSEASKGSSLPFGSLNLCKTQHANLTTHPVSDSTVRSMSPQHLAGAASSRESLQRPTTFFPNYTKCFERARLPTACPQDPPPVLPVAQWVSLGPVIRKGDFFSSEMLCCYQLGLHSSRSFGKSA